MTDKVFQWVPVDSQKQNHVELFKELFRPVLENSAFSVPFITDAVLTAPLFVPTTFNYFGHEGGEDGAGFCVLLSFFKMNWVDRSAELGLSVTSAGLRKTGVTDRYFADMLRLADMELGLERVCMNVLDGALGHAAAKRMGMVHEGTMRHARRFHGEWKDAHLFAWVKLKEE